VTGGGSGIGTMMAATLVQNGAKVYIASRKEKQLREVRLSVATKHFLSDIPIFFKVSEALNKRGPGTCSYIVADLGVRLFYSLPANMGD
jgi:NAD(P)-dependent dehydrogenase (short-subunit alcohol dehydrogenase family)